MRECGNTVADFAQEALEARCRRAAQQRHVDRMADCSKRHDIPPVELQLTSGFCSRDQSEHAVKCRVHRSIVCGADL